MALVELRGAGSPWKGIASNFRLGLLLAEHGIYD